MGKSYQGTPEYSGLLTECAKYSPGTKPSIIHHNIFDGTNPLGDLLHKAGRTSGATGIYAVYKQLTLMLKDPAILSQIDQIRKQQNQSQSIPTIQQPNKQNSVIDDIELLLSELDDMKCKLETIKSKLSA